MKAATPLPTSLPLILSISTCELGTIGHQSAIWRLMKTISGTSGCLVPGQPFRRYGGEGGHRKNVVPAHALACRRVRVSQPAQGKRASYCEHWHDLHRARSRAPPQPHCACRLCRGKGALRANTRTTRIPARRNANTAKKTQQHSTPPALCAGAQALLASINRLHQFNSLPFLRRSVSRSHGRYCWGATWA